MLAFFSCGSVTWGVGHLLVDAGRAGGHVGGRRLQLVGHGLRRVGGSGDARRGHRRRGEGPEGRSVPPWRRCCERPARFAHLRSARCIRSRGPPETCGRIAGPVVDGRSPARCRLPGDPPLRNGSEGSRALAGVVLHDPDRKARPQVVGVRRTRPKTRDQRQLTACAPTWSFSRIIGRTRLWTSSRVDGPTFRAIVLARKVSGRPVLLRRGD